MTLLSEEAETHDTAQCEQPEAGEFDSMIASVLDMLSDKDHKVKDIDL